MPRMTRNKVVIWKKYNDSSLPGANAGIMGGGAGIRNNGDQGNVSNDKE